MKARDAMNSPRFSLCARYVGFALLLCNLLAPLAASGQSAAAEPLLAILKRRPANLDQETWRTQRREAARELGRQRERRAVPLLLGIIEKERFDVILEIAIDALGNIGDRRAIEPLRGLLADPSLDAYVRDAVAGALKKLGSAASAPSVKKNPRRARRSAKSAEGGKEANGSEPSEKRGFARLPDLRLAEPNDDLLSRSQRLELLLGSARFDWEGRTERTQLDLALGGHYLLREERKTLGMTIDAAGDLGFATISPKAADASTWQLTHQLQVNPELRFYPFQKDLPLLFGQVSGGAGYGMRFDSAPNALDNAFRFASTLAIAVAPGYGRVIDIASKLRLDRIVYVLRQAGLLEPVVNIDRTTANQIFAMWFQLRDKIGSYSRLGYTLRLLRKANLLRDEVDPATAYKLIRILDDPQLFDRRQGYSFRLGYGYARTILLDGPDLDLGYLFSTASWHRQVGTSRELGAEARFVWSHVGEPDTVSVTFDGYYNWYRYNRSLDPLGGYGVVVSTGLSSQSSPSFTDSDFAYRLLAGLSYTRFASAGTRVIAAMRGGFDNRGGLFLLTVEARIGTAVGSMALIGE